MSALVVLGLVVMLGVVREVERQLVVGGELDSAGDGVGGEASEPHSRAFAGALISS